ncbi:DUF427 domain-containing protein [Nocardioides anomalus]|uniref:DUF427 domain-containing protein n=1 Tax=Nocardioides anomalus TaxID=2712223 RepID=A0A6G6WK39_9ACTN|nr:DUF427 domain-containing protein [Nocardioides anomalus]QIG45503.1 DUF427 domain-containing protein [Nocardioides anomalus]
MAIDLDDEDRRVLPQLRHQRLQQRVRALRGDTVVVDSTRARLVWEPRRPVASYAVPEADVLVPLEPGPAATPDDGRPVLDPRVPFAVHSAPGEVLSLRLPDGGLAVGAAYRLADPDLADHLVLDFAAFDWRDEEDARISHPRDPRHRIDVFPSARTVRIEHAGRLLAESARARWLFEGTFGFPRYYLPREDVAVPLERDPDLATACAYKGVATYWSVAGDPALSRIAWSYEEPLVDATSVRGLVCFFTERLDLSVDATPVPRPWTPWSDPD